MNLFTKISVLVLIPIMVFAAQDPSNVPALRARLAQCDKLSDGSNMSLCVANVGANTDTELNRVYAALTAQYAELAKGETHDGSDYNTQLLSRLRIAERAWLTYRDAQCNADVGGAIGGIGYTGESYVSGKCIANQTLDRISYLETQPGQ